ncbi:MAG TPA: abortive infection family protein [Cyclobacteriaceae bacterium]|nr:abortive infection family protein [Cyclobacteriaceae bacterium]
MAKITNIEKGAFLSLFNRAGYVLNFSTDSFDVFTQNSIGLALCNHYGLSKGKSLTAYVNEAHESEVIKLFGDLLEYYEVYYQSEINNDGDSYWDSSRKEYQAHYKKCRAVMDRIKLNLTPFTDAGEKLKEKFSSAYVSTQIDIMLKMQSENPTEAIGKSKEFIECCCKTILEENQAAIDKDWNVSQLVKATMKLLEISTDNVDESTSESRTVKAILGNLHGIAGNIAELRNAYGSGHGKSASYKGLTVRHAKLAVGSSITLVNYLWDTYEWRKENGRLTI